MDTFILQNFTLNQTVYWRPHISYYFHEPSLIPNEAFILTMTFTIDLEFKPSTDYGTCLFQLYQI